MKTTTLIYNLALIAGMVYLMSLGYMSALLLVLFLRHES